MGEEVAGDPEHPDPGLALQLEGQVCYFIQILVGLLQRGAFRGHVSVAHRGQIGQCLIITMSSADCTTFKQFHTKVHQYIAQQRWRW